MLVLSRKKDEKLVIGDSITVTVVDIRGDTVKIGIDAPIDVRILRAELLDAVRQANIEAAKPPVADLDDLAKRLKGKPGKDSEQV